MSDHLFSIDTDRQGGQVTLHLDLEGINLLIGELKAIRKQLKKNQCPHSHMMTLELGGGELSGSRLPQQGTDRHRVQHLKICGWNQEWKQKHGL